MNEWTSPKAMWSKLYCIDTHLKRRKYQSPNYNNDLPSHTGRTRFHFHFHFINISTTSQVVRPHLYIWDQKQQHRPPTIIMTYTTHPHIHPPMYIYHSPSLFNFRMVLVTLRNMYVILHHLPYHPRQHHHHHPPTYTCHHLIFGWWGIIPLRCTYIPIIVIIIYTIVIQYVPHRQNT